MSLDPNSPKILATVLTEQEATLIVNHLAPAGIKALIAGAGSATGWPEARGYVQVVVRQADVARAKELLKRVRRRTPEISD